MGSEMCIRDRSFSCLESSTADSSSSGDSGSDGATCLQGNTVHHFCASSSSSPSSLVEGSDNHTELPSSVLSTITATCAAGSAKPCQRTIDALSKKIQRNQTQKTDKPITIVSNETLASNFARPDSSCPTPPLSRQLTSSSLSSSASLSPSDACEISAVSGHSKFCQHEAQLKNDYADVGTSNHILSTRKDCSRTVTLPARRKRTGRRKSQTSRHLSTNGVVKVMTVQTLSRSIILQLLIHVTRKRGN